MKTRAAILVQSHQPLIIDDIVIPPLKRGQILVKIHYAGVCRAQYNEITALKGPDLFLPHLLGHEATATVIDCGPGITRFKSGDRVCLSWIKGQGLDGINAQYQWGKKQVNAGGVTTFSDYAVVSENRATRISKTVDLKTGSILGCAVLTGGGIVQHTLKGREGQSLLVFGCGGIGLNIIMAAKSQKMFPIVAVDTNQEKMKMAKAFGATQAFLFSAKLSKNLKQHFSRGFDFAVDASGHQEAMEMAFASLHDRGLCVIAGNLGVNQKISLHPFDLIKGKRIIGSWGGESQPQKDIPKYARLIDKGQLPVGDLITHVLPLYQINDAFDILVSQKAGRIVIKVDETC